MKQQGEQQCAQCWEGVEKDSFRLFCVFLFFSLFSFSLFLKTYTQFKLSKRRLDDCYKVGGNEQHHPPASRWGPRRRSRWIVFGCTQKGWNKLKEEEKEERGGRTGGFVKGKEVKTKKILSIFFFFIISCNFHIFCFLTCSFLFFSLFFLFEFK